MTNDDRSKMPPQREHETVSSIMSSAAVIVPGNASLLDAAVRMQAARVSVVLVMEGDAVKGILSEHDLVRALGSELGAGERVGAAMTPRVVSVPSTTRIQEAFQTMTNYGIRHLMVVDAAGQALGILSEADFLRSPLVRGSLRPNLGPGPQPDRDASAERQQMLDELERRNWALRALSLSEKALAYAANETEMLAAVCEAVVSEGKYLLAWIGWATHDREYSVPVAAHAGRTDAYLKGLKVSWAEGPPGQGPTGRAIRTNRVQVESDAQMSTSFAPWWDRARSFGIQSVISAPLKSGDRTLGAMTIYSGDAGAFGEEEVKLFEELAEHIVFGIESRRTRLAYEKSLEEAALQAKELEKTLEESLAGMAAVFEQGDPYTAGHQEHVADLAVRIGREMGLGEERLRVLYLSGMVHDIGKVQIPAEILAKPARLNAAEFALVKQHPEVGYNILRKIDLPWPIADVIRQHHEYLDGSGYPLGLKAEDIIDEARIITVADIVESMSSDRPYRPALGISEAVSEICRLRGSKLDPAVVDACVTVLSRGEFSPHILSLENDAPEGAHAHR